MMGLPYSPSGPGFETSTWHVAGFMVAGGENIELSRFVEGPLDPGKIPKSAVVESSLRISLMACILAGISNRGGDKALHCFVLRMSALGVSFVVVLDGVSRGEG